jgi:L-alanine-DL-glutamate epimerase-like enolase superfamily enzyme
MKIFVEDLQYDAIQFRTPLQFAGSILTEMIMPRVTVRLTDGMSEGIGRGAMPLGNVWSFPSVPHEESLAAMRSLTDRVRHSIHGLELGDSIFEASHHLESMTKRCASQVCPAMPTLSALVVFSPFDIACFDAWGVMAKTNTFARLAQTPEAGNLAPWLDDRFRSFGLNRVVRTAPADSLPLFHCVGGLDPLTPAEVAKPIGDGLPEHLEEWIDKDQITHLKIKLHGDDPEWDFQRIVNIDRVASDKVQGKAVYSLDFNEKCRSGMALVELLRRLQKDSPDAFQNISYIEQPTSRHLLDRPEDKMHEAARLKPVVIDEALTDYDALKRALSLGYSGVALKACKGIGPSLLMAAACRMDNLFLCVQDLTCPGLALLASTSLAAWLGVSAIEANARQFCPVANAEWARRRPEVFTIRNGRVRTQGFGGKGLGFE